MLSLICGKLAALLKLTEEGGGKLLGKVGTAGGLAGGELSTDPLTLAEVP